MLRDNKALWNEIRSAVRKQQPRRNKPVSVRVQAAKKPFPLDESASFESMLKDHLPTSAGLVHPFYQQIKS